MNGSVDLGLAAAGACLVGAAAAWRLTARRGARKSLRSALRSSDRESRLAALHIVAAEGIAAYSAVLRQRAAIEPDDEVRRALAEVVARSQWEPAADEALVELRLWAHRHLEGDPAVNAGAPGAAPGEGGEARDGPEAGTREGGEARDAPEPSPAEELGGRPREPAWWHLAPKDPSPTCVVVTGAGGPAGVAVMRWLRAAGHRVVAADADPLAVGLRLGDSSAVIGRCDEPDFVESLCAAARRSGARLVVPTIAEEFLALAAGRSLLEAAGLRALVPEPDAVLDCTDKWRFAKVTQASEIPVPPTNLGSADGIPGPYVVKPRFGRGSRDVVRAAEGRALSYALSVVPDPIVQTQVTGREFTVDALVAPGGELVGAVPRWRLETRGGISTRGETFKDASLVEGVERLLEALSLVGAVNVQGFLTGDGRICFIEVNPRFSGGLPLSLAAGADLVGEYLRGVRGVPMRKDRCAYRSGVRMLRYFEDVFEARA